MSQIIPPDPNPFTQPPPADPAAEQSVLGGMMLSKDAIADVVEVLRPGDFYRPAHQAIYECVLDLYGRGEPVDAITVSAELERRQELLRVGGAPYMHTLIATVPTAANAGYYAEIVSEKAVLRRLVEAGTRIVQLGYHGSKGSAIDEVVDHAQATLQAATAVDHATGRAKDLTRKIAELYTPIDWHQLWATTTTHPDWLVPDILERGRSSAIVAPPKTGKSLLTLNMVAALASKRPLLGDPNPHPRALRILYIDIENALDDLRERLGDMQYHPQNLADLIYLSFPDLPALDSPLGGEHLHALVDHLSPDLVVFDTTSRIIAGEENRADTFRALYRYALAPLKARGVGSLRLDHTGKDVAAGQRGSSAKADDLDTVWLFRNHENDRYTLQRTYQRTNHHPETIELLKTTSPLTFTRIHAITTQSTSASPPHAQPEYPDQPPSAAASPTAVPAARNGR